MITDPSHQLQSYFERLVLRHIKASLPPTFDPHQFAYREHRSTEDTINITLHLPLQHLEHKGTYVQMLFIDYSSAFNTIMPAILIKRLLLLGVPYQLCT